MAGAGPFVPMVLLATAGIASLQIGYVVGIVIRYSRTDASTSTDAARSTTRRRPAL
jgi:hypothetical protein